MNCLQFERFDWSNVSCEFRLLLSTVFELLKINSSTLEPGELKIRKNGGAGL
jgi:hypothetical protein